jgi:threonine dehydratase
MDMKIVRIVQTTYYRVQAEADEQAIEQAINLATSLDHDSVVDGKGGIEGEVVSQEDE